MHPGTRGVLCSLYTWKTPNMHWSSLHQGGIGPSQSPLLLQNPGEALWADRPFLLYEDLDKSAGEGVKAVTDYFSIIPPSDVHLCRDLGGMRIKRLIFWWFLSGIKIQGYGEQCKKLERASVKVNLFTGGGPSESAVFPVGRKSWPGLCWFQSWSRALSDLINNVGESKQFLQFLDSACEQTC